MTIRRLLPTLCCLLSGLSSAACASRPPPPDWPISSPAELCDNAALDEDDFCMPVEKLEAWLRAPRLKITKAAVAATGMTAPRKLRLESPEGLTFNVKFKPVPEDLDSFNNSPRREIAAYEIQHLFLSPEEYVVPPTVLRCIPVDEHRELMPNLEPFDDSDCALGVVAYWVENIDSKDVINENDWKSSSAYRDALGRVNTLTILIGHQDDIGKNFYRATDDDRPRVVSIDNGLSMGAMGANPVQLFSSSWSSAKVPSVPADTAERLEGLTADDIEPLMTVAQVERRGRSWAIAERQPPIGDVDEGVRISPDTIQLGLTADEVTQVHTRLAKLLGEIRKDELDTHPESETTSAVASERDPSSGER